MKETLENELITMIENEYNAAQKRMENTDSTDTIAVYLAVGECRGISKVYQKMCKLNLQNTRRVLKQLDK